MDSVPETQEDHNILLPPPTPAQPHMRAASVNIPTVPVIPPGVTLAGGTRVQPGHRGKVPGVLTPGGWTGRGVDTFGTPTQATARRWDEWGASAGIPAIRRPALDADISDPVLAARFLSVFLAWRRDHLGVDDVVPLRYGRRPKWLTPFVLAPGERDAPNVDFKFTDHAGTEHMIQMLGRGKHYVACGWHPDTRQPYEWTGLPAGAGDIFDAPQAFLQVTMDDLADLQATIEAWLKAEGFPKGWRTQGSVTPPAPKPPRELRANTPGDVTALMAVLPNVKTLHSTRTDWVQMAQALRGALPDDLALARDLFVEWSLRWVDEDGNALPQVSDPGTEFDKTTASHTLGWDYLVQRGRDAGLDFALIASNPAGTDFQAVDDEGEMFKQAVETLAQSVRAAVGWDEDTAPLARPKPPVTADMLDAALDGDPDAPAPAQAQTQAAGPAPMLQWVDAGADEPVAAALGPRQFLDPLGHYEKGNVVLLAGRGGSMKTALELTEAMAFATGRPLLGWTPTVSPLKVLHVNLDEKADELRRRLRAIALHHGIPYADFAGRLFFAGVDTRSKAFRFTRQDKGAVRVNMAAVRWLEQEVVRMGADIVMVDPLGAVLEAMNDNGVVYDLFAEFSSIAARRNVVILFAVHQRKSPAGEGGGFDPQQVDAVMGAASITNAARLVRFVTRMTEAEAEKMGVLPADAWRHIRVKATKGNHVPHGGEQWFKVRSVSLNNAQGPWPDDEMAVIEPWAPPSGNITATQAAAILQALAVGLQDGRRYSAAAQASPDTSAQGLVMREAQVPAAVAKAWVKARMEDGTIYEDEYVRPRSTRGGGSGKSQRGLFVNDAALLDALEGASDPSL